MLEIGSILGDSYQVLVEIGKGGTSHVYLVMNTRAGKQWAAKEVSKNGNGEKGVIGRHLIADVEILKGLRHDHIPAIVDVIEKKDYFYILMDYVEGVTLQEVLQAEGAQDQEDVVKWGLQLCSVFSYLHAQNPKIIYRDCKPPNIMLKPNRDVVLIDFGAAREYKPDKDEDTTYLGTRGYAAPEQFASVAGQSDERTDIYNLGATMYHLVTGHNPSQYPYDMYPIRRWNPELSTGLERIILKCTKANPDERYQTAQELAYDLEHYKELDDGFLRKKRRKKRWLVLSILLSGLCLVGSAYTRREAAKMANTNYEQIIRDARLATTNRQAGELYREAIRLKPNDNVAYLELLSRVMLDDGNFTREEAEEMTSVLGAYAHGTRQTNEAQLAAAEGYAEFAYQMGLAYFYYYDNNGNKQLAEPWLKTAAESTVLETNKTERAIRLANIAGYYVKLSMQDKAGDAEGSYREFWDDLSALTDGNLVAIDNARTAYVMYREMTYQIRMHANDFRKAGIEREALEDKLADIESHINTDFAEGSKEDNMDLIGEIGDNITAAYKAVETAYAGREG